MTDEKTDTQAERMPNGPPETDGAAIAPLDTATGQVKAIDGPMDRPGTEAEEEARKRNDR